MTDVVAVFDLREAADLTTLRDRPLTEALSVAVRRHDRPGSGVVRPFDVLIVDTADTLDANAGVYGKFAEPALSLRTMLVVIAGSESSIRGFRLPAELDAETVGVLWVSNPAGTLWSAGDPMARGFGSWPADPDGEAAFAALVDTLTIPEVFIATHRVVASPTSPVHTVGLRRWVFGLDSGESIHDFVHEAGLQIAGDRGIDPARSEPRFWSLPPELTGDADADDSVFTSVEGSVVDLLDKAEKRVGALHRLAGESDAAIAANRREDLVSVAVACGDAFDELVETGAQVLQQVDATDGIDHTEHWSAKRLGVNLHPEYTPPSVLRVSEDMLETVVWDLEQGHSLEPLLGRMASDAEAVRIPSAEERIAELRRFEDSEARQRFADAASRFPNSIWSRVLGVDWRAADWRLGALLAAVTVLIGTVVTWMSGRVTPEKGFGPCLWEPGCQVVRDVFSWNLWPVVFGAVAVAAILAVPILLHGVRRMARLIRDWINGLGSSRLAREARDVRKHVASVILNDWVLRSYRNQAESTLSTARSTLQQIGTVVSERMIAPDVDGATTRSTQLVNPLIETNLNVGAGAVLYRAFSPIVELIRLDVIALVTETVRSFWPRLQARSGEQIPKLAAAAVDRQLEAYLGALDAETLLLDPTGDAQADARRRSAFEALWQNRDLVAGTVRRTLEADRDSELLQMVGLGDLPLLDASRRVGSVIRFVPSLAHKQVEEFATNRRGQVDVVLTEHLTAAGVLRLAPFRDGVVSFGEPASSGVSQSP